MAETEIAKPAESKVLAVTGGWARGFGDAPSGWAASAARIAIIAAVLTPLLIALVAWERVAAVRKAAASATVLRYESDPGVTSLRREAVEEFRGGGRPMTCSYVTAPGYRVSCPGGFGVIEGSCSDGAAGDLLVAWDGTGWLCPSLRTGAASGRSASVLCCKWKSDRGARPLRMPR